jgi:uncharacterized membrane protein YhdT
MVDLEPRRRRLERARYLVRVEFALAIAAPLVAGFLVVAAPGTIGGGFREPPLWYELWPWAGVVAYVVGIAWMIRIYRSDPEAGESPWRYRDF